MNPRYIIKEAENIKMIRNIFLFVALAIFVPPALLGQNQTTSDTGRIAGFRASRILESYPNMQFPTAAYWANTGKAIAGKFSGTSPAGIWIVSIFEDTGFTTLNFPSNGRAYPHIGFTPEDQNEDFLTRFDNAGIKIWLQVEPGSANIDTLISVVLNRYKHHPCVRGFGIDVEWYQWDATNTDGKKVTNAEAQKWEQAVQAIDTSYTLFLKHYNTGWMPSSYRGKILFVDDSQDFTWSTKPFEELVAEYKTWGKKFSPSKVAFQFGYEADSVWWRNYSDPVKTIGSSLFSGIANCFGVFWVDFTITRVFPYTGIRNGNPISKECTLSQNYPNPFNPSTKIRYNIAAEGKVTLTVYNVLGQAIKRIVEKEQIPGEYEQVFDGSMLTGGVYYYRLHAGSVTRTGKMLLVK